MREEYYYFVRTNMLLRRYLDSEMFKYLFYNEKTIRYEDYLDTLRLNFYSLINRDLINSPRETYIKCLDFENTKDYMRLALKETNDYYIQLKKEIKKKMNL